MDAGGDPFGPGVGPRRGAVRAGVLAARPQVEVFEHDECAGFVLGDDLRALADERLLLVDRRNVGGVADGRRCADDADCAAGGRRRRRSERFAEQVFGVAGEDEGAGDESDDAGQRAHRQEQELRVAESQRAGVGGVAGVDARRSEERQECLLLPLVGGEFVAQDAFQRRAGDDRQVGRPGARHRQVDGAERLAAADVQRAQGVQVKDLGQHALSSPCCCGVGQRPGMTRPKPSRRSCSSSAIGASQRRSAQSSGGAPMTSNQ